MAFPNPPADGQVYDHPNGLEYVYSSDTKTWDLVYATGTNTGSLPLINPTNYTLPTSLPEVPPGLVVQADYNAWVFDALRHVNKEANIEVEAAPGPANPDEGRLWYNSDTDKLYLYYNDGSSSQWVEIVGGSDDPGNTYRIETDPDSGHAQIQLVDQDDNFSNVHFSASGDINVTSTAAKIEYSVDLSDIRDEQQTQNNQINAIETQIQLLAQTQAAGKWRYERYIENGPRPPRPRTFYGTHKDDVSNVLTDWSDLRLIMVDKQDLNDTIYTFANFEEGDKIEILATDGSSACFGTVTNNPTQESYGNMIVTVERSNGGPAEGKEYILSVYRPGANGGDVDLDILDDRYVVKTGDTISGSLHVDNKLIVDGQTIFNEEVVFWAPQGIHHIDGLTVLGNVGGVQGSYLFGVTIERENTGKPDYMEYYGPSNTDKSLVNRKWVEEAIQNAFEGGQLADEYLPITGGVLTGNLVLGSGSGLYSQEIIKSTRNSGYAFQVKPDDGDETAHIHTNGSAHFGATSFDGVITFSGDARIKGIDTDGSEKFKVYPSGLLDTKGEIRIDRTGTDQAFAVKQDGTAKFIVKADGKAISNYNITSSSADNVLVTKGYVDEALSPFRPAQLAWVYDGDKGTTNASPPTRRFALTESSGNKYLRFSYNTNNGVSLGDGKFADTNVTMSNGPIGTIWEYISSNGKWKLKRQFRVEAWRWNFIPPGSSTSHFEFRMSSSHGHDWDQLSEGVQYYITVGGFF